MTTTFQEGEVGIDYCDSNIGFGLVSLFNDISTFVGYLMPKPFSSRRTVVVLFNP